MNEFWSWFDTVAKPELGLRQDSMMRAFAYLDSLPDPITIVETGCLRQPANWADGQSTMLFARYVAARGKDARAYSIDLDAGATEICRGTVGAAVDVRTGDSVAVLPEIVTELARSKRHVSLLYLDSYDVDFADPMPSAIHHLMELASVSAALHDATLVLVDDSPTEFIGMANATGFVGIREPRIGGKGRLLSDMARRQGIEPVIGGYQVGWIGLGAAG